MVEPAQPRAAMTLLLYQEPVFSQVMPEPPFCLALGIADDLGGETVALPDGMGQITWLPAALARRRAACPRCCVGCCSAIWRNLSACRKRAI